MNVIWFTYDASKVFFNPLVDICICMLSGKEPYDKDKEIFEIYVPKMKHYLTGLLDA